MWWPLPTHRVGTTVLALPLNLAWMILSTALWCAAAALYLAVVLVAWIFHVGGQS